MRAGLVVKFDGNANNRPALGRKVGANLFNRLRRCGNGGRDSTVGRLAKFGFEAADDGNHAGRRTKSTQQKFAAGSLSERKLCAGVNGAEMVEILLAGRKPQQVRRVESRLNAEKAVERKFCDAVRHAVGSCQGLRFGFRSGLLRPLVFTKRQAMLNKSCKELRFMRASRTSTVAWFW